MKKLIAFLKALIDRGIISLEKFHKDFSERLKLQKLAFLVKELGYDIGYDFGWYLRGPYSSSLANDVFDINRIEDYDIDADTYREAEAAIDKLISIIEGNFSNAWLETLSSIVFMIRNFGIRKRDELINRLMVRKPWLKRELIERAIETLERNDIIKLE